MKMGAPLLAGFARSGDFRSIHWKDNPSVVAAGLLFCLGPLFNPQQLMRPQSLKCFRPLIQWTDTFRIRPIHHVPPIAPNSHQPYIPQNL